MAVVVAAVVGFVAAVVVSVSPVPAVLVPVVSTARLSFSFSFYHHSYEAIGLVFFSYFSMPFSTCFSCFFAIFFFSFPGSWCCHQHGLPVVDAYWHQYVARSTRVSHRLSCPTCLPFFQPVSKGSNCECRSP